MRVRVGEREKEREERERERERERKGGEQGNDTTPHRHPKKGTVSDEAVWLHNTSTCTCRTVIIRTCTIYYTASYSLYY